jgi:hypothetical protein
MPVAATTTRTIRFARPSPLAAAWTHLVAWFTLLADVMREAKAAEREAHQRTPFVDW